VAEGAGPGGGRQIISVGCVFVEPLWVPKLEAGVSTNFATSWSRALNIAGTFYSDIGCHMVDSERMVIDVYQTRNMYLSIAGEEIPRVIDRSKRLRN
jgi:hypothetical protein